MSHVTCHMSHVTCHMSLFFLFFWTKKWSLLVEGLLLTGPTPSSFLLDSIVYSVVLCRRIYAWLFLWYGREHIYGVMILPVYFCFLSFLTIFNVSSSFFLFLSVSSCFFQYHPVCSVFSVFFLLFFSVSSRFILFSFFLPVYSSNFTPGVQHWLPWPCLE